MAKLSSYSRRASPEVTVPLGDGAQVAESGTYHPLIVQFTPDGQAAPVMGSSLGVITRFDREVAEAKEHAGSTQPVAEAHSDIETLAVHTAGLLGLAPLGHSDLRLR